MITTRTGTIAAALALTAATTVAAAPAHAVPAPAETGVVQYAEIGTGSAASGSMDNPIVQAGLLIVAGVGVSIALAVGAGLAGGAFELPQIPDLPY